MHALFLAVMEKLNSGKKPLFGFYWAVANDLAIWPCRKAIETWPTKGMPIWGRVLWKSLWEFEGCIKVGHVNAHHKNPLPGFKDDWN